MQGACCIGKQIQVKERESERGYVLSAWGEDNTTTTGMVIREMEFIKASNKLAALASCRGYIPNPQTDPL